MKRFAVFLSNLFLMFLLTQVSMSFAQKTIEAGDSYNPDISPANFTIEITNPYFSLPIGKKIVYEALTADGLERTEILVPGWTKTVSGIETLVYWDRVYLDGQLIEDTRDYLAQHKETGDVWYFGENVDNYEDGEIVDNSGAWLTGEDKAKPGIWILANPQVGDKFRSEYRKAKAEDESEVLSISETVKVPFGMFRDCAKHIDGSPLFPDKAHAYYCKGVGAEVLGIDLVGPETPEEQRLELIAVDLKGALGIVLPEQYAVEGVVAAAN